MRTSLSIVEEHRSEVDRQLQDARLHGHHQIAAVYAHALHVLSAVAHEIRAEYAARDKERKSKPRGLGGIEV